MKIFKIYFFLICFSNFVNLKNNMLHQQILRNKFDTNKKQKVFHNGIQQNKSKRKLEKQVEEQRTFWENIARYFFLYYAFFLLMGFVSELDYSKTKNDAARLQSIFTKPSRRLENKQDQENLQKFLDHILKKSSLNIPTNQLYKTNKNRRINNRMLQKLKNLYYNINTKDKIKNICLEEKIKKIPTYDQFSRVMFKGATQLLGVNHKVINHCLRQKGKLIYYYVVQKLKKK